MKNLLTILFLVITLISFSQDSDTFSTKEIQMIKELLNAGTPRAQEMMPE